MSSDRKKSVLITGFGPYPGVPHNPSGKLARALADQASNIWPDFHFTPNIFATEWSSAHRKIKDLFNKYDPVLALHFGMGRQKHALHIERRARNYASGDSDQVGCAGCDGPIHSKSPIRLTTNFPVMQAFSELDARGIPVHISNNAGTYLCNYLFYNTLLEADNRTNPPITGFVHLPTCIIGNEKPERRQTENRAKSRLTWPQLMDAGLILLAHGMRKAHMAQPLQNRFKKTVKTSESINKDGLS